MIWNYIRNNIRNNIRWLLARALSVTALFIGCFTSATVSFKTIPFILTFYPFNLVVFPNWLVSIICIATAHSGITNFYSNYGDAVHKACRNLVDWCTVKFLRFFYNLDDERLKQLSNEHKTPLELLEATRAAIKEQLRQRLWRNRKILHSLYKNSNMPYQTGLLIECKNFLSSIEYGRIEQELKTIHASIYGNNIKELKKNVAINKQNSITDWLCRLCVNFINVYSITSIIQGSAVVIGLGVLTNQGFLQYYNIEQTTFMNGMCVIFAVVKQICQMVFTAGRQHRTNLEWAGIKPRKEVLVEKYIAEDHAALNLAQQHGTILKSRVASLTSLLINKRSEIDHLLADRKQIISSLYKAKLITKKTKQELYCDNNVLNEIYHSEQSIINNFRPTL